MAPGHLAEIDVTMLWSAIETTAEQAGIAVYVVAFDSQPQRVVYASPRAAQITGRPQAELIGSVPWSILHASSHPTARQSLDRPVGAPPVSMELIVEQPDGKLVPIELSATRIHTARGVIALTCFRDVSAEHDALAALRQSEARFRFLVQAAPDGVVILVRGKIVFINPRADRLFGLPEGQTALGRNLAEFLPPAEAKRAADRIAEMLRLGNETPPNEYNGFGSPDRIVEIKSVACEWEGSPAVLAVARDVTERKAMQRRLVEADRLAALGTLAAGVAHEINNPMTYARLAVQRIERTLASVDLPVAAIIRGHLGDIEHGISRVASITRSLRTFARPDDAPPGPVDLAAVVDRSLRMVANDLRHRAQLVVDLPEVPWIIGNASRLEQVLVNVLLNAIQALPEDGSHQITVTRRHEADRVTVAIRDTGRGMSAAVRDRIFEPFFTTRPMGEGMGLGLSVSKTIIDGFGGGLAVISTPGAGTTVTISLRVHTGPRPEASAAPRAPVVAAASRLRVLLIDDEPVLRTVFSQLLSRHHDIATAGSGVEALATLARSEFDVIVCDVVMPEMNGCELYRRIAVDYPGHERRIVFITGGTFTRDLDDFIASTPNRLLPKPFNLEAILAAIDQVACTRLA